MKRLMPLISIASLSICTVLFFELSTVNSKLDALLLTQERAQKSVEKRLEQAKLYEEQGRLGLAKTLFLRSVNSGIPTVEQAAEKGLLRLELRASLAQLDTFNSAEFNRLEELMKTSSDLSPRWREVFQFLRAVHRDDTETVITLGQGLLNQPDAHPEVLMTVSNALIRKDSLKQATTLIQDFLKIHQARADIWAYLGQLQRKNKAFKAAIKSYEKALTLKNLDEYRLELARCHMSLGDWQAANTLLKPDQMHKTVRNDAFKLKAACLFQLKQYEVSAQYYQKAHRLVADPNTLLSRVIALQVAGKHGVALKDIESLLPRDDILPQVHYHHAQSLDKVGLTYEASLAFVRFLKHAEGAPNQRKRVTRAEAWLRAYNRSLTVPKDLQQRLEQPSSK
ncbi:MAG: tetratricopeptide repeat protein [Bradymonadia bacterium]